MQIITYSLHGGEDGSWDYYRRIQAFVDSLILAADHRLGEVITDFVDYQRATDGQPERTGPEYVLDLLVLGVLWRVFGAEALGLRRMPQHVLSGLAKLRRTSAFLKPFSDMMRGALGGIFLQPSGISSSAIPRATLSNLDRLLAWLGASGSFVEEAKRLRVWRTYLASLPPKQAARTIKAAVEFGRWFEQQSSEALGLHTEGVDRFLAEKRHNYRWREDAILCGRRRVEYHLCMVGTEILNRAFRKAFLATQHKVVLLPPCMSAPEKRCQAKTTRLGAACAGCTPSCRVHQVTKMGEKHGFTVLLLPDELSVFSQGDGLPTGGGQVGVVGVSCALTNVTGGWECREHGIPAQGILLDYCGCSWHWHSQGFPTDFNIRQFLNVMQIEHSLKEVRK